MALFCTYEHHSEREPLQWTAADYRTYFSDLIAVCCSWLDGEEQWLLNALTINHPGQFVWYGRSQRECRGDGLMSGRHGWSYQINSAAAVRRPTASTQELGLIPKGFSFLSEETPIDVPSLPPSMREFTAPSCCISDHYMPATTTASGGPV